MSARSLPRSLLTSVGTSVLDLGIFVLCSLHVTGILLVMARWLSGAVGALTNFTINRRWAFRAQGGAARGQLLRYALVAVGAVTLATLAFAAIRRLTSLDLRLAHLTSLALVWVVFTYPLLRAWVFRGGKTGRSAS